MSDQPSNRLRAATFLVPSIPVEFFESILSYFEKKLKLSTTLLYDSRTDRLSKDRLYLFQNNEIDLAWMSSTGYLDLIENDNHGTKLLPITTIHDHSKSKNRVGIYSDVVYHKNTKKTVKSFDDLRGSSWAYNRQKDLAGFNVSLSNLRKMGENASFFGNLLPANSHLEALKMVIDKKVDSAAVDANCLALYLENNDLAQEQIEVLTSWGPLPPYAMVIRSGLPDTTMNSIQRILLDMHADPAGAEILTKFRVIRFSEYDPDVGFQREQEINSSVKNQSFEPAYY